MLSVTKVALHLKPEPGADFCRILIATSHMTYATCEPEGERCFVMANIYGQVTRVRNKEAW